MNRTVITVLAIAAAGAYFRWGIRPVVVGFHAGRVAERIARQGAHPAG
jgi:hypothetical protein